MEVFVERNTTARRTTFAAIGCLVFVTLLFIYNMSRALFASPGPEAPCGLVGTTHDGKRLEYNSESPIIFVGGAPRSGTTLMRAILDSHTDIHCGPETRVIPAILKLASNWKSTTTTMRLDEAGLPRDISLGAVRAFILHVLVNQKRSKAATPILCNKDPLTNLHIPLLLEIFPNAKVVQMVRDGRAMVHSAMMRNVTISGWNLSNAKQCLEKWNGMVSRMYPFCKDRKDRCLQVPYEALVQYPEEWTKKIAAFVGVPWEHRMLEHDHFINAKDGIDVAEHEKSSDQIAKPIYLTALTSWVGEIPQDVLDKAHDIAPFLAKMGYDPWQVPPNYKNFKIRDLTDQANAEKKRRAEGSSGT